MALLAILACGCGGAEEADERRSWTRKEAESVTVVRGLTVRVRHCRGVAAATDNRRYRSLRCLAGARATSDSYPFETVAVRYVLHPLGPPTGRRPRRRLTDVRFVGGPGIP